MPSFSILTRYQQAIDSHQFMPDDAQKEAVNYLDAISLELTLKASNVEPLSFKKTILQWLKIEKNHSVKPVKGLYLWGGVGRGKTWLMDLFYDSLPGERKLRLHFHHFMLRVHEDLTKLQGQTDPLNWVADKFKSQTDVLCFDEFFVSDIADAMLLGALLEALFARGITLVATSNIPPENLYHNGLQRARFLPAIALIMENCYVFQLDKGIDYRLRTLINAKLWLFPLNSVTHLAMENAFGSLTQQTELQPQILEINHRKLPVLATVNGILMIDFITLCGEARGTTDYIALSHLFHTVLLVNVPVMTERNEDQARRFLALIDEFYERHIKLLVSAQTHFLHIYQGKRLNFEYQRCLSRLQEMQSETYLSLEHLP